MLHDMCIVGCLRNAKISAILYVPLHVMLYVREAIIRKKILFYEKVLQTGGGVISFSYLYFFSKTVWNLRYAEITSWIG